MTAAPPSQLYKGVDHLVVLVRDLDAAAAAFSAHGFLVGPRNAHPSFGTANRLIVFPNFYVELLAIVDHALGHTPEQQIFAARLLAGEGHWLTALAPADLESTVSHLRRSGVAITPPRTWERQADTGARITKASFTTAFMTAEPGPTHVFFLCAHHTPEAVYEPALMDHPNGAGALSALTLRLPGGTKALERHARELGGVCVAMGPHRVQCVPAEDGANGPTTLSISWGVGPASPVSLFGLTFQPA